MKTYRFVLIIAATFLLAACSKTSHPIEPQDRDKDPELLYPAPENPYFRNIAYFPSYRDLSVSSIPDETLQMLDVACYAFATINSRYELEVQEPSKLSAFALRCKKAGVKLLISFSGSHKLYKKMVATRENRGKFLASVKKIIETYSLDGVDNDWEYPRSKDTTGRGNTLLMYELSNYCHAPGAGLLLTMAITPGKYAGSIRDGIQKACFPCVDWFNIMIYNDFSTDVPGKHHSDMSLLKVAHDYWITTRGLPPSKFVSGIPVYGCPSGITQRGTTLTYATILKQGGDPDANEATVTSSKYMEGKQPYTIYYNGRVLVREKTQYSIDHKLGGVMFWEAGQDVYDDRSLMRAAYEVIQK